MQQETVGKAEETIEKIAGELNGILYKARADKAHSTPVAAARAKAKLLGLQIEGPRSARQILLILEAPMTSLMHC